MADPKITPALREFGFGAKRILEPLSGGNNLMQSPVNIGYRMVPDIRDYRPSSPMQTAPVADNIDPYYRIPSEIDRSGVNLYRNDYARGMDARVAQADAMDAQRQFNQQKMLMDQQELLRAQQARAAEDEANAAIAQGVPVDQVIRQIPRLAQSKNFGNYARQVPRPAQNTLAPHFRQMLKSPEARADFDEHFSHFGDVQKADDHAREREAYRKMRIDAIEGGVPLEVLDSMAGSLTPERVAALKQQHKAKASSDPAEHDYREALNLMVAEDKAARELSGEPFNPEAFRKKQKALRDMYFPPTPVAPAAAATAVETDPVKALAKRYGILKTPEK